MQLNSNQKQKVKEFWGNNLNDNKDLLILLNEVKRTVFGEKMHPFKLTQLNYHAYPKLNNKRYVQFLIPKKNRLKLRIIHAPNQGLKTILQILNLIFQCIEDAHHAATGFVPGKSIVDNALVHVGSQYVLNLDLQNFFPSISEGRIYNRLRFPPFNLNKETGREPLASFIASLCCHSIPQVVLENGIPTKKIASALPQGAPTSPTLTNFICTNLDRKLYSLAKNNGLKYTRYADDITFSSMYNAFDQNGKFMSKLKAIIQQEGFTINPDKTRLQKRGYRQEVTGLVVNEKVNVQKRYIKNVRFWLNAWEKYGEESANERFLTYYTKDKGHIKSITTENRSNKLRHVIGGKLLYLQMVKRLDDSLVNKLKMQYQKLLQPQHLSNISAIDTSIETNASDAKLHAAIKILISRGEAGIDAAMKIYLAKDGIQ